MLHESIFWLSLRYIRYNLYRITWFCNKKPRMDHVALRLGPLHPPTQKRVSLYTVVTDVPWRPLCAGAPVWLSPRRPTQALWEWRSRCPATGPGSGAVGDRHSSTHTHARMQAHTKYTYAYPHTHAYTHARAHAHTYTHTGSSLVI